MLIESKLEKKLKSYIPYLIMGFSLQFSSVISSSNVLLLKWFKTCGGSSRCRNYNISCQGKQYIDRYTQIKPEEDDLFNHLHKAVVRYDFW